MTEALCDEHGGRAESRCGDHHENVCCHMRVEAFGGCKEGGCTSEADCRGVGDWNQRCGERNEGVCCVRDEPRVAG